MEFDVILLVKSKKGENKKYHTKKVFYNQYCNHQQQNVSISLTMIFDNLLLIILVTSRHAFYISNEMLQTRMEMRYLSFSSQTSFCLKKINIEK